MKPPTGGLIVRTVAEGLTKKQLKQDVGYLVRLWGEVAKKREGARAPANLLSELDIVLKTARDLLTDDVDQLVIDDKRAVRAALPIRRDVHARAAEGHRLLRRRTSPSSTRTASRTRSRARCRARSRCRAAATSSSTRPRRSRRSTSTRVASSARAARTWRRRSSRRTSRPCRRSPTSCASETSAGSSSWTSSTWRRPPTARRCVRRWKTSFRRDKAKTTLNRISELGLIEMTRKRTRESLGRLLHEPCFYCDGTGHLQSKETIAYEILREIRRKRRTTCPATRCSSTATPPWPTCSRAARRRCSRRPRAATCGASRSTRGPSTTWNSSTCRQVSRGDAMSESDKRVGERVTINKEFESFDAFIQEYVTNISRTGVFIKSQTPLADRHAREPALHRDHGRHRDHRGHRRGRPGREGSRRAWAWSFASSRVLEGPHREAAGAARPIGAGRWRPRFQAGGNDGTASLAADAVPRKGSEHVLAPKTGSRESRKRVREPRRRVREPWRRVRELRERSPGATEPSPGATEASPGASNTVQPARRALPWRCTSVWRPTSTTAGGCVAGALSHLSRNAAAVRTGQPGAMLVPEGGRAEAPRLHLGKPPLAAACPLSSRCRLPPGADAAD